MKMKDKNENKTMQLQTKVSPEVYGRLQSICKRYGFSVFEMLRMLSECIVRYMDDRHNLSDDLARVIRMFEDIPGWGRSICLTDGLKGMDVSEAFYVLRDGKNPGGSRLAHVARPVLSGDADGWTATYNIQQMTERFIEVVNPSLYRHLRQLAADLGTESMLDTMHTLANLYRENPDERELRLQFESNDWHQGAQTRDGGVRYQRRNSHSEGYLNSNLFNTNTDKP